MISRKATFFLGIFIFVIPFFGVPSSWKTVLVLLSGLYLILLSIKIILPRKSTKIRRKKDKSTSVFVQSDPIFPSDNVEKKELKVTSVKESSSEIK